MKDFIVIPTYNEKDNIVSLVGDIFSLLPQIYILVVDDNSPDGTAGLVTGMLPKYPRLNLLRRPGKNGLGAAYIEAFKKLLADNEIVNIVMMDGDFSHNPKHLRQLLNGIRDYGLVMGSRYIKGGGIAQWELWRRILSAGGNTYVRMVLGKKIHDWTGGFNCIKASCLRKVDLEKIDLSGYAFIMG
ncbi:MAG: glycosyltransferase, partial [Candidatus Levybacteria bacterium]|nr:glycosyltransferase [Candidatus Levybacteria bacterium]